MAFVAQRMEATAWGSAQYQVRPLESLLAHMVQAVEVGSDPEAGHNPSRASRQ